MPHSRRLWGPAVVYPVGPNAYAHVRAHESTASHRQPDLSTPHVNRNGDAESDAHRNRPARPEPYPGGNRD